MWDSIGTAVLSGGPWGIVGFGVLSLIRGWLIPRSWHLERIQDYKDTIKAQHDEIAELKSQRATLLGAKESV